MTRLSPPPVVRPDRESMLAAARAENLPIDLHAADFDDGGWENLVLATADGWIVRFPRGEHVPFRQEVAVLRRLARRLTVPIPEIVWTGRRTRMAVYRKLAGAAFSAADYLAAPAATRDRLVQSLVDFLVAMHHGLTAQECDELNLSNVAYHQMVQTARSGLDSVPHGIRDTVELIIEQYDNAWVRGRVPGPDMLLHNDFHVGNLVLSDPVGQLAGVWDFSCVQIGVPTYELRYFAAGPRDLLHRLAEAYMQRTGIPIDVRAAILAHRLERICDGLESGRHEYFDAALSDEDW